MHVQTVPPTAWDSRILSPVLSSGFGEAITALGWRPFYAWDASDTALVLIRRLPVPGLRRWTARARVYLNYGCPTFVRELRRWLDDEGVGYATFGDAVWPLPDHLHGELAEMRSVGLQRIVHDVQHDDATLRARMEPKTRTQLRKAERSGVLISEIVCHEELKDFLVLGAETAVRIRQRNVVAALPDAFFRAILRTLVPRGQATFLIARAEGRPLAGALFLNSAQSMTYYHGVSTRDPSLAPRQGPSALVWHAMRRARERRVSLFDHGAVTVTDDPAHPHYSVYDFKRRFGGRLEAVLSGELVLSRAKHAFQQRVLLPAWRRLHPLYVRVVSETKVASAWCLVALAM